MIQPLMKAVREFNKKHGFPLDQPFGRKDVHTTTLLLSQSKILRTLSDTAEAHWRMVGDLRARSTHLILQEVGELLEALAFGDSLAALDALADTTYVVTGCALTFDWPLAEALTEVHRSNMSKSASVDPLHPKGPNFTPPNLQLVLNEYRATKAHYNA